MGIRANFAVLQLPAQAKLPADAALTFVAYGRASVQVYAGALFVETGVELWSRLGSGPSQDDHFLLVRPLEGRWPSSPLSVSWEVDGRASSAEVEVQPTAAAGAELEWSGPLLSTPAPLQFPALPGQPGGPMGQRLWLGAVASTAGPAVQALLTFSDGSRQSGALEVGPARAVLFALDAPVSCIGVELTDAAGRKMRFGEPV